MLPVSGEISFNAALIEVEHSSGTEHTLSALMDELNKYTTGASHSADSMSLMQGYWGTVDDETFHFLHPTIFFDDGEGEVVVTVKNWSPNAAYSGSMDYWIYNSSMVEIGSGSLTYTSVAASSTQVQYGTYSGTAYCIDWNWAYYTGSPNRHYF